MSESRSSIICAVVERSDHHGGDLVTEEVPGLRRVRFRILVTVNIRVTLIWG